MSQEDLGQPWLSRLVSFHKTLIPDLATCFLAHIVVINKCIGVIGASEPSQRGVCQNICVICDKHYFRHSRPKYLYFEHKLDLLQNVGGEDGILIPCHYDLLHTELCISCSTVASLRPGI